MKELSEEAKQLIIDVEQKIISESASLYEALRLIENKRSFHANTCTRKSVLIIGLMKQGCEVPQELQDEYDVNFGAFYFMSERINLLIDKLSE